jgi:hypothetical protein
MSIFLRFALLSARASRLKGRLSENAHHVRSGAATQKRSYVAKIKTDTASSTKSGFVRANVLLAALTLACACGMTAAAPYPNENQLQDAIGAVAHLVRSEGMGIEIVDARKAGVSRPLMAAGLNTSRNLCMVFYNPKPVNILEPFFTRMPDEDLMLWLKAIAVHELTHCVEQREAYVLARFDRILPPGLPVEGMTVQGYVSAQRAGALELWGEALSDVAAVLWMLQTAPTDWKRFALALAQLREELAPRNPSHLTVPWLHALLAAEPHMQGDKSIFDAAIRLRTRFRPR